MNEQIWLGEVSAKLLKNRMGCFVEFSIQVETAICRPKASKLVVKLIAVNALTVDRVATVKLDLKVRSLNTSSCGTEYISELSHGIFE